MGTRSKFWPLLNNLVSLTNFYFFALTTSQNKATTCTLVKFQIFVTKNFLGFPLTIFSSVLQYNPLQTIHQINTNMTLPFFTAWSHTFCDRPPIVKWLEADVPSLLSAQVHCAKVLQNNLVQTAMASMSTVKAFLSLGTVHRLVLNRFFIPALDSLW